MFEVTKGGEKEEESKTICEFMTETNYYVVKYLNSTKDKIIFNACTEEVGDTYYTNEFTYENLCRMSSGLSGGRNIESINELFSKSIYYNPVDAKIDKYNENILHLIINIIDSQDNPKLTKKKDFELIKVTRSKEEMENLLNEKLNFLIRQKKDYLKGCQIKKIIDDKREEQLISRVTSLEKKINLLDERCKVFMNVNLLSCSNILNSLEDWQLIIDQLKKIDTKYENILFKLIYSATRDGDSSNMFHEKCDNIGPNITLVKTGNGYRFGGYTKNNWEHLKEDIKKDPEIGSSKEDINAFCFSLDLNKIYKNCKYNEGVIFCCNNYGPTFCRNFFSINDKMLSKGGYCLKKNYSYFEGQDIDYEITGGKRVFKVVEVEVLEILFI